MRRRGLLKLAAGLPFAAAGLSAAPASAANAAEPLRGRVAGLLAREDHLVRPGDQNRLRGLVLRLPWKTAQPTPESGFDGAAEALLDRAEAAAPPDYPFLKLRLLAGADSPPWTLSSRISSATSRHGSCCLRMKYGACARPEWRSERTPSTIRFSPR